MAKFTLFMVKTIKNRYSSAKMTIKQLQELFETSTIKEFKQLFH